MGKTAICPIIDAIFNFIKLLNTTNESFKVFFRGSCVLVHKNRRLKSYVLLSEGGNDW